MVQKAKGATPIKAHLNISDEDLEDLMSQYSAEKSGGAHVQVPGRQFTPYTGGPQQARDEYRRSVGYPDPRSTARRKSSSGEQGQLFDKESIPLPEAHTQTPEQFAKDPRTWWHGRVTKGGPRSNLGGNTEGRGEGFHAGTREAAEIRVTQNVRRRGLRPGMAGHLYPLRITGDVEGPEQMREDVSKHIELGPRRTRWGSTTGGRTRGYLYENAVEGVGSISVGVPAPRKNYLSTQREMVKKAKAEGKYVHPTIEWAATKTPEHTPDEIKERVPQYQQPKERQMFLHEGLIPSHVIQGAQAQKGDFSAAGEMQRQMQPSPERTERRSYVTESGKTQHIWRDVVGGPGSALNPKQWTPLN